MLLHYTHTAEEKSSSHLPILAPSLNQWINTAIALQNNVSCEFYQKGIYKTCHYLYFKH